MVWIDPKYSLPDIDEYVLWRTIEGNYFVEALDKDGDMFPMSMVTHWAYIDGPLDVKK